MPSQSCCGVIILDWADRDEDEQNVEVRDEFCSRSSRIARAVVVVAVVVDVERRKQQSITLLVSFIVESCALSTGPPCLGTHPLRILHACMAVGAPISEYYQYYRTTDATNESNDLVRVNANANCHAICTANATVMLI